MPDEFDPAWSMDAATGGRGTAVVIEVYLILRDSLVGWLEGLGFAASAAGNGFSGLRLAQAVEPDLVVLDLAMPDLSGQEVLAAIREDPATADTPVLVVTGLPGGLPRPGPHDRLLPKPFSYDAFAHEVDVLASGEVPRPHRRASPRRPETHGSRARLTASVS